MAVIDWLLEGDPAIRWQVMRDLADAPENAVAAERARVADEGWGARLLALQQPHGQWRSGIPAFSSQAARKWWHSLGPAQQGTLFPEWTSTTWSLALLRAFGLEPDSAAARRAIGLVRESIRFSYLTFWHYDVLRGLDYLRAAGATPDDRVGEAIELVRSKRDLDGRWPLENPHRGELHFALDDGEGKPSRWNTLRAMRVLRWHARAPM